MSIGTGWLFLLRLRRLARLSRQDLPVSGIEQRVEVVLTRDLQLLDVLLERFGHRRGESGEEIEFESLFFRSHKSEAPPRAIASCALKKRCGATGRGGLAFTRRRLGAGTSQRL